MRYFEIHDPYYALIKADIKEEAIQVYDTYVADSDSEIVVEEISRDSALVKFARGKNNGVIEMVSEREIIEEFNRDQADILLITSELT
ncbi:hypothetical protein ACPV3A_14585 [Paenibacillus sp. Dod16]|uniref:hypothetical protein n=1 Tax=Paenibacillus sp. Dod16 TaxID=3416392 RepID=UPI003CE6CDB8